MGLAIATLLTACADEVAEDSSTGLKATLEPLLTIGDDETADPMYLFGWLRSATLAADGAIVAADGTAQQVRAYDAEGRFSHLVAREGEGPGEVQRVNAVVYLGGDTLAIYDIRWPLLTLVSVEGDVHEVLRVAAGPGQMPDVLVGRSDAGWWVMGAAAFGSEGSRDRAHHYRSRVPAEGLELIAETPSTHRFTRPGDDPWGGRPHPLAASVRHALVGDSLYLTDGVDSVTVLPLDGSEGRSFRLPSRGTIAVDDALAAIARYRASVGEDTDYDDVPRLDRVPRTREFLADDQGRLWFQWYVPEHDSSWGSGRMGGEWVVTSLDGASLFEVDLPNDLQPLDIRGDRLLGRRRNDLGVESVAVYRILPPSG